MKKSLNTIRLLVIEDNRLLRDGISALFSRHHDIKVVAAIGSSVDILREIRKFKPDVILLDLGLRNHNSLEIVRTVKKSSDKTKLITMDLVPTQEDILEFVKAGVSGFLVKDATIDDFLSTIRLVAHGTKVLPPHLAGSLFSQIVEHAINGASGPTPKLVESVRMTKRERQVIMLISDGMSNKEIANKLHLSTYTVKSHVHNILEKLALHTRVQIAKYAHATEKSQEIANSISLMNE